MSDLTDFLRARLDEDEYVAERSGHHGSSQDAFVKDNYGALLVDPAHVLRDIEAKRDVLDLYDNACDRAENGPTWDAQKLAQTQRSTLRGVLTYLAGAYADRPGYREEWRP